MGRVVADYEVLAPLSGGTVFEARTPAGAACVVAIIDAPPDQFDENLRRRLLNIRTLNHPNVVRLLDVRDAGAGQLLIAYEALSGTSLATVVAARGELSAGEIAHVWDAIGSALAALHERGVVHGDVSADNVVVTEEGTAVLIDVGAGIYLEAGTAGYQAPERVAGGPASAAGDVFALGRLLTGLTPARSVASRVADALAADPARRPACRDLAARCHEFAAPKPIALPAAPALAAARIRRRLPVTEQRPPRRLRVRPRLPVRAILVGAAGLAMVGAGLGAGRILVSGDPAPPPAPATASNVPARPAAAPDPVSQLGHLLAVRDAALNAGDDALLDDVYAPGAPPRDRDRATIAGWERRGVTVAHVATEVQVRAGASPTRIEALVHAGPHERSTRGSTERVPASEPVCMVFTLAAGKIADITRCP